MTTQVHAITELIPHWVGDLMASYTVDHLITSVQRKADSRDHYYTQHRGVRRYLPWEESTWADADVIRLNYPQFNLEDKVYFKGRGMSDPEI